MLVDVVQVEEEGTFLSVMNYNTLAMNNDSKGKVFLTSANFISDESTIEVDEKKWVKRNFH